MAQQNATFKAFVENENGFKAWQILATETPSLRTNITELNAVLENLDFIEKIGTKNYTSWKLLKDANRTKLMNDAKVIQKLTDVLADNSIRKTFGDDLNDIMKKFITAHKNDNWRWNKFSLEVHLDKLKNIVNKYEGVEGFNKSLRDALNNPAPAVQDGLWHMITDLEKRNISKDKIKAFDLEFDGEDLPCIKCKFDVELITQNTDELRFLEYKSYKNAENISKTQFLNYIAKINDIKQLQYVFSKNKLTLQEAKNGMKKFFDKNAKEIFEANPNLFNKIKDFDGDLIEKWQDFRNYISDKRFTTDNKLFDFIKTE